MREIPRVLLDEYTAQLNALSKAGQQLVLNALANAEWQSIAELRDIMIAVMGDVCSVVADDAAVVASDMYDDIREMSTGRRLGQTVPSSFNEEATAGAVRALIQSVVATGAIDTFGRGLAGRVDYEVKKSAGDASYKLGAKDPAKPRFARVPSGVETCSFCLMLASRGFVYHSDTAAGADGHYHDHCDCRIVPGFEGMEVEGYDPDSLYERYKDCVDTIDDDWLYSRYRALLDADRGEMPFDEYKTKQILAEMRSRDSEWLNKGILGTVSKEPGAKPLPKEGRLAELLSLHGYNVRFLREVNTYKVKTPDALLNRITYEFKVPEKYNEKTIKNQFKTAVGKGTGNLVIGCGENLASISDVMSDVKDIFDTTEYPEIVQVLIVGADGAMKRIRRR